MIVVVSDSASRKRERLCDIEANAALLGSAISSVIANLEISARLSAVVRAGANLSGGPRFGSWVAMGRVK